MAKTEESALPIAIGMALPSTAARNSCLIRTPGSLNPADYCGNHSHRQTPTKTSMIYVYTYIYTYIHVYEHMHKHTYIHTYIYIYIFYMYICITHIYIYMDADWDGVPSGPVWDFKKAPRAEWS